MNDHSVGVEVDATAKWLEERGLSGAARLLRRVARQRDDAVSQLGLRPAAGPAYPAGGTEHTAPRDLDAAAEAAMLRTDVARLQALAERAGWVPDRDAKRLWRWRDGWWELSYHRRNPKDGYHDTGWYLWGPVGSYEGEYADRRKGPALDDAERLITLYRAAMGEGQR
ncbi:MULTISPECIES: hypothetical protein [unclassified Streptomyces]|uniref:hypothetical protein n=1 Tax=Streptomyces TaxID=1883 RepID=UPI000B8D58F2|nr:MULTISPECIES: hypothetical protein [unclassified Streptomyces]ASQ94430.1 hypothetical protein CGL27_16325 [Streptomyces sp. 11-1-2]RSS33671.1 hypothetical protein EF902_42815 [Streptomyces sp. WAC05858]